MPIRPVWSDPALLGSGADKLPRMPFTLRKSSRWPRQSRHRPTVKRPLPYRFGELILLMLFVAILAGRFSLSRLDEDAVGFDLRFVYAWVAVILVMLWRGVAHKHLPKRLSLIGAIPFTLWCGWLIFSAWWAPDEARTGEGLLDFGFLFTFVTLSWFVMSCLPAESLDRVWKWLLVTGVIYFVLAIAAGPEAQGRYAAPGGGSNTFVRIMVAAAIAALYLAIVKRRTMVLCLVPLFAVGAALSGSRGGLASAAIVMALFLVPVTRLLGARKSMLTIFFFGVGIVLATSWRDGYLIDFVQERFIQQTLIEGYSSGRDEITGQVWGMFVGNPVGGVGLDGFYPLQHGRTGTFEYPHNLVLGTLAEGGMVGGLLLATGLLRLVGVAAGKSLPSGVLFALIVGLYFFGTAMFSGDYYDSRFIWFFLGLAAILASRGKQDDTPTPANARVVRDGGGRLPAPNQPSPHEHRVAADAQ